MKRAVYLSILVSFSLFAEQYYYSGGKKIVIEPQRSLERSLEYEDAVITYRSERGTVFGVDRGIVAMADDSDIALLESRFGVRAVQKLSESKRGTWLFEAETPSLAVSVSARMSESGIVTFAHPDFIQQRKSRTADPLYSQAWHLQNTGQSGGKAGVDIGAVAAWAYTKGAGVKLAVYDDAVDIYHEDLIGAFAEGYDFDLDTSSVTPAASDETHGTEVAGLALARENSVGSVGVAPKASLYVIKQTSGSVSKTVKAFEWAKTKGVDVINCSWGTYDVSDAVRTAIDDVATNGRGGKGAVVVFASGNDSQTMGNDESALASVVGVGSVTNLGEVAWYSNFGPGLDLLAPSGGGTLKLVTTDVTGSLGNGGYAHPNYVYATESSGFNGTSASSPIVAGVAALVLGANPNLTRAQVQEILTSTAVKTGQLYSYQNGRNDHYGYGIVNAKGAVERALALSGSSATSSLYITLHTGWNLYTPSQNGSFSPSQLTANPSVTAIWEYDSYTDSYKVPSTMESGHGYWVKSSGELALSISQFRSNPSAFSITDNTSSMSYGKWYLLGVSSDTSSSTLTFAGVKSIWAYDTASGQYVTPATLTAGTGFWAKK